MGRRRGLPENRCLLDFSSICSLQLFLYTTDRHGVIKFFLISCLSLALFSVVVREGECGSEEVREDF